MDERPIVADRFGRLQSLPVFLRFAANPITTLLHLHAEHGRYVILQYPHSRYLRPQLLPLIADAGLYRTVASSQETWRTVNVTMRAFKGHAANRLSLGMTRLRGSQHAHYRRLLAQPLSKPVVASMGPDMSAIAKRNVESWPRDRLIDFVPLASNLMQDFAISLLFGADSARAAPVAGMIGDAVAASWLVPGRAYFKWLRTAPKLERAINLWAEEKRGVLNPDDIFSVLVNNQDENGNPPSMEVIAGILVFAFGAGYDTCQNALAWTLMLLAQHPQIAAELTEEIDHALGGGLPSIGKLVALPLLDGVIKESMRLFPPVPLYSRRSLVETELGGERIPAGTRVLTSLYLINRDPDLYGDPQRFMPERWQRLDPSPFEYPVFGAGGRMCPGVLFGNQMLKIALAAILTKHRVELASEAHIDYRLAITLTPHPAIPVILRDRTSAIKPLTRLSGSIRDLVDLPAGA